jgi:hypothetical protein
MTEQRPDEEVEGHASRFLEDPEGEGAQASEEDAEGHLIRGVSQEEGSADPDDVEGHGHRFQ